MVQMIEANWLIFIAALLIGIVVAYWLFVHGTKSGKRDRRPDVLDEGAAPAKRNQALIDSPPAAHIDPPAMAGTMAGIGEVIAVAAQEEVDAAEERAHAEPPKAAPEAALEPTDRTAPAAAVGGADDLRRIKGLGPKMLTLLNSFGITRYEQIANWTEADLDELDAKLGSFAGRPRRDNWVEQARFLASGDTSAYEAKFGKL